MVAGAWLFCSLLQGPRHPPWHTGKALCWYAAQTPSVKGLWGRTKLLNVQDYTPLWAAVLFLDSEKTNLLSTHSESFSLMGSAQEPSSLWLCCFLISWCPPRPRHIQHIPQGLIPFLIYCVLQVVF